MPHVTVSVNGRNYRMACDPGQEDQAGDGQRPMHLVGHHAAGTHEARPLPGVVVEVEVLA